MPQETSYNKLYVLLVALSIAVVVIAVGLYASVVGGTGAKSSSQEQKGISVTGSASSLVTPDTASIDLGVLTQAATAREASEKNTASMNAVISALKSLGLQDKDIRTSLLSIQPVYSSKDGGMPVIMNYSASNNVRITTKMLDKLGDIVDRSVAAGANQVSGISFEVSEEKQMQIRDELIANAVKDAKEKADKLAENLQVRIIGVRTSSIGEISQPMPLPLGIADKTVTPIFPGESRIEMSVQVTYITE